MTQADYEIRTRVRAARLLDKGHDDPSDLRELLILTTNTITEPAVAAYFRSHHGDNVLLKHLIEIALEGEDMGDAPWAAANTIADFPASMLTSYRSELETLSQFEWSYLNVPAQAALAKLKPSVG